MNIQTSEVKPKTKILHRYTGAVLFECETPEELGSGLAMRHALEKAVAAKADLSFANLSFADLRYADLSSANLSYADLSFADLRSANLSFADLRYADLSFADLRYADLRSANLSFADLRYANLRSADLMDDKKLVGNRPYMSIGPIGSRDDYLHVWITDKGPMIRAGCFFDTRDQFELQVSETHGANKHAQEYAAALVLADKHIKLWTPRAEVQS